MRGVRSSGTLMCLASAAAFGAMGVFGKLAYGEGATVGTLLAVRFALAALLFWALIAGRGALRALPRRDVALGLGLGAGGYALQAGCYFAALERIDASLLSLLLYTFPAIVAAAAVALGRERLDARKVAALALASGGLVLVVAGAGAGALDPLGAALGLAAALVYSAYILVSEPLAARVRPTCSPRSSAPGPRCRSRSAPALLGELRPGALTAAGWGWLACLAVVSTVGAIALFFAGLRRVGPTTASILATVEPLVTVLLAFLAFGEPLGDVQLAGGALVLAAVVILCVRIEIGETGGHGMSRPLDGKVALVAGATRGGGRGIAVALGEAGATVYATGRSTRERRSEVDRPETIEETAELVTEAGGRGDRGRGRPPRPRAGRARSSSGSTPSRAGSTCSSTTSGAPSTCSSGTRRSGSTTSRTGCGCCGSRSTRT